MVINVPKGVYTIKGKMSIIKQNASLYQKSKKKEKSIILDELTAILPLSKKHLASFLRNGDLYIQPVSLANSLV